MTRPRALALAAALATSVVLLAGCGSQDPVETVPTTPAPPTAVATSPAPSPSSTAAADADPTCETIIPESTVADYEEVGWTAQADVFRIGGTEVPGGIQCTWGDYSVATDHVQVYGWAPIDEDEADQSMSSLISEGWRREDGDAGTYITESADSAIATDAEGYGFTYFFGDGFVTLADTKQSLLLIDWPAR
ncbi:hypothetical protein ACIQLJ_04880 [Microbacterium sp. NPDC091313]